MEICRRSSVKDKSLSWCVRNQGKELWNYAFCYTNTLNQVKNSLIYTKNVGGWQLISMCCNNCNLRMITLHLWDSFSLKHLIQNSSCALIYVLLWSGCVSLSWARRTTHGFKGHFIDYWTTLSPTASDYMLSLRPFTISGVHFVTARHTGSHLGSCKEVMCCEADMLHSSIYQTADSSCSDRQVDVWLWDPEYCGDQALMWRCWCMSRTKYLQGSCNDKA